MSTVERPGWAMRLSSSEFSRRIVTCVTCGRAMAWREYLRHGPTCTAPSEDPLPGSGPAGPVPGWRAGE